jgi:hypothetical protein
MTQWFGESWGAPCCDEDEHCETPVGKECLRCKVPIAAGDQGVTMPFVKTEDDGTYTATTCAYHYQCYIDTIICPGCPRCQPLKWS